MSVESDLVTALGAAGVTALVSSRVYPAPLPEDATLPAVTYQRISSPTEYHLAGRGPLTLSRFQINSVGATYTSAHGVAEAVSAALDFYQGNSIERIFLEDRYDRPDPDPKRFLSIVDVYIWSEE